MIKKQLYANDFLNLSSTMLEYATLFPCAGVLSPSVDIKYLMGMGWNTIDDGTQGSYIEVVNMDTTDTLAKFRFLDWNGTIVPSGAGPIYDLTEIAYVKKQT